MIKQLMVAKKMIVVGVALLVMAVAGIFIYRHLSAHIYIVVSYEPAGCTQDIPTSSCTDAYVTVRARDNTTKVFSFNGLKPPKFENSSDDFSAFKQGNKIELTTSGDTVLAVKVVK